MRAADALTNQLTTALEAGITDDAMKKIKKAASDICDDIHEDITYRLQVDLAANLAGYVVEMARDSVTAILEGNEDQMRRYLSCTKSQWTGRDREHSVIHGTLFETGAIALRKKIVEAHKDLLTNERLLDLEAQNKSLVEQVNKRDAEIERLRREYVR